MVYIGPKSKSVSEHLSRGFLTAAGVSSPTHYASICKRPLERELLRAAAAPSGSQSRLSRGDLPPLDSSRRSRGVADNKVRLQRFARRDLQPLNDLPQAVKGPGGDFAARMPNRAQARMHHARRSAGRQSR